MSEERKYCVYMHENKYNGKVYVGMTSKSPEKRWQNGNGYKKQSCFYNAILKYTWNGFLHTILKDNLTFNEACKLEKNVIQDLKSCDREFGYNRALGGKGRESFSEETIQKISSSMVENFGVSIICLNTGEIFECIMEACRKYGLQSSNLVKTCKGKRRYCGKDENGIPLIWRYYTDGVITKLSTNEILEIANSSIITKYSRKVVCLNTKEIFESIAMAENYYKIFGVRQCCVGKYKSSGSLNGELLQWMFYTDYIKQGCPLPLEDISSKSTTKVACLNDNKLFNSLSEACDFYAIKNYQNIVDCCKNFDKLRSVKSGDGLKLAFAYYEDYIKLTKKQIECKLCELEYNKDFKVLCVESMTVYKNSKIASLYEKGTRESIFQATHKNKTSFNNHWMYFKHYENLTDEGKDNVWNNRNKKVVCLETNKIYNNVNAVEDEFGFKSSGNIKVCCEKNNGKSYGYSFRYLEEKRGDIKYVNE